MNGKIVKDYEEILAKIAWYKQVLADEALLLQIVREEFVQIRDDYGDERRTEIIDEPDEILPEDLINPEEMVVTVSHGGYIKRNPLTLYRSQRRGGKGVMGMVTLKDDFVSSVYTASSLDTFLFFTNLGRVFGAGSMNCHWPVERHGAGPLSTYWNWARVKRYGLFCRFQI